MPQTSSTLSDTPAPDAVFSDASGLSFEEQERKREADARRRIAFVLVSAYVGLLAMNLLVPIVAVKLIGSTTAEIAALKSASESVASILTGVAGVLGFVLGYYFKSEEHKRSP
jgi:hypothetical protein